MAGAVFGASYDYQTSVGDAAGLRGLIRGAFTGVLIGGAVSSFTAFVVEAPARLHSARRW